MNEDQFSDWMCKTLRLATEVSGEKWTNKHLLWESQDILSRCPKAMFLVDKHALIKAVIDRAFKISNGIAKPSFERDKI